jgi:deoxyribose-phosphate aldolase
MSQENNIASLIDHTYLNMDADELILDSLLKEAQEYGFNSICIRSNWINKYAKQYRCSSTIGFPESILEVHSQEDLLKSKEIIGNINIMQKLAEFRQAALDGALELDPVVDINNLERELNAYIILLDALNLNHSIYLKPIFSCELLSDKQIEDSIKIFSQIVQRYYAGYGKSKIKFAYKNSTGFVKSNTLKLRTTSVDLISLIATMLNKYDPESNITIKAAGGIRNYADVIAIQAAADGRLSHIGTSSGLNILAML